MKFNLVQEILVEKGICLNIFKKVGSALPPNRKKKRSYISQTT